MTPCRFPRLIQILALCLGMAAFAPAALADPRGKDAVPVVIELFTSQGCSSCPPADQLMQQWAANRSVIALSLHVDYWDYLGWKDTLGKRGHSDRQQAYARSIGSRQVYTPQVVVDGQYQVVGSNNAAVAQAVRDAQRDMHLPIGLERPSGKPWNLKLPTYAPWEGDAVVWLCLFDRRHEVAVERGENRGRKLTYVNVAREWKKLDTWTGIAKTVPLPDMAGYDWRERGAVVLLQAARGPILGALELGPAAN